VRQDYHRWKRLTGEEAERHARHHLHHLQDLQHSPQQHGVGGGASVSGCLDTGWHPAEGHPATASGERPPQQHAAARLLLQPPPQHGRAEHTLAYAAEHTRVDQMMLGRVPEAAEAEEEDTRGLDGGGGVGGGGAAVERFGPRDIDAGDVGEGADAAGAGSCCYMCVLILLYVCPHTTIYMSSCYYILYMCATIYVSSYY
jgi:hypothetical protein